MARELSPFSARRLLTQKLADERNSISRNGSPQTQTDSPSASNGRRRSRSRDSRPRDLTSDHKTQAPASKPGSAARDRGASPEPYRRPRDSQSEKRRDRSPHRKAHSPHDRRRDRSRDGATRKQKRSHSRERRRERSASRDEVKRKRRDRSEDRHSRRHRSRSRERRRREKSKDRHRSKSPPPYRSRKNQSRSRSASTSPPPKRRRRTRSLSSSRSPSPRRRAKKPLPSQEVSFRGLDDSKQPPSKYGGAPPNKEKPNFKLTGILAKFANRVEGTKISLKYHEPPEARKPSASNRWRIFVFKGEDVVDTIELWQKSCWLFGRTQEVVDYLLEHPSSSGQHAVIQFRYIQKTVEDEFGVKSTRGKVKPYVIDLDSSNGTELNGKPVEASRYFELRDKDVLKFAGSEREYVIMLPPPEEQ